MLFVGNQRGGAQNLARHLLSRENDHVEVHEVRGFASDTVPGAFNEAYAMSKGTQCRQFLFSLSINPPKDKDVSTQDFEEAVDRAESRLGLEGQPRAIVFHEKEGRRHAHAVWSRIDTDEMKAVQLSFTHRKLMEVSRELHIEHGWQMPRGMADPSQRDPKTFSLAEWQQAKRRGQDPRAIRGALQDAWAISDSRAAFTHALSDRGMTLARGDRRGFVVVDRGGGLHALGKKTLGVTAKAVRDRLGKPDNQLPDVEAARQQNAAVMQQTMGRLQNELEAKQKRTNEKIEARKAALIDQQRTERKETFEKIEARRIAETHTRQARFRAGLSGLWDRIRGEHKRIRERNEHEAFRAYERDRAEKDRLVWQQLEQRKRFEAFHARQMVRQDRSREDLRSHRDRWAAEAKGASVQHNQSRDPPQAKQQPRGPSLNR